MKNPSSFSIPALAVAAALVAPAAPAAELRAEIRDANGAPVADAVVVAVPATAGAERGAAPRRSLQQRDKEFRPRVLPVEVGTAVDFPNNDEIGHHVYSFSPAKQFELPLYSGTPGEPVVFDKPGVVVLGCNIHDWMVGYIYVADSPYFAKTGDDGRATLTGLPPGDYSVRVWHPQLAGDERASAAALSIPAAGAATARTIALKPDFRSRRAPIPGRSGY